MDLITPLYAGLLTLVLLWLSVRVVLERRRFRVSVGDGGERAVTKAMRAQSNFVEYAPMGVILLALSELQGAPGLVVHLLGLALLTGRVLHAWGFGSTPQIVPARAWGMYLTLGTIGIAALANIAHAII